MFIVAKGSYSLSFSFPTSTYSFCYVFGTNVAFVLDGVAPRAKMNQQRSRRLRSAQDAKAEDEKKVEFAKLLKKQKRGKKDVTVAEEVITKTWDTNVITPGTPFMDILALALRYWVAYKLSTDPGWEKVSRVHHH